MITDINADQGAVKVDFMHLHGPFKTFKSPQSRDTCYVSMKDILCDFHTYHISYYKIADVDYQNIISALLVYVELSEFNFILS